MQQGWRTGNGGKSLRCLRRSCCKMGCLGWRICAGRGKHPDRLDGAPARGGQQHGLRVEAMPRRPVPPQPGDYRG